MSNPLPVERRALVRESWCLADFLAARAGLSIRDLPQDRVRALRRLILHELRTGGLGQSPRLSESQGIPGWNPEI